MKGLIRMIEKRHPGYRVTQVALWGRGDLTVTPEIEEALIRAVETAELVSFPQDEMPLRLS